MGGDKRKWCVCGEYDQNTLYTCIKNVIMKPIIMYGEHVNKNTLKYVTIWF